jgi:hypothetical protein
MRLFLVIFLAIVAAQYVQGYLPKPSIGGNGG